MRKDGKIVGWMCGCIFPYFEERRNEGVNEEKEGIEGRTDGMKDDATR